MARMFSAADEVAVASLDSIEDVTYTPPVGDPVELDHITLDLAANPLDAQGVPFVDTKDTITVLTQYLARSAVVRGGVFSVTSDNPQEDGDWRVNQVLPESDDFETVVGVRKDA